VRTRERLYDKPRIAKRAAQAAETESLEEGPTPAVSLPWSELRARALDPKATEPVLDIPIDLDKLDRRVPRTEIRTPV
jgi:hypothetical protein